MFFNVDAAGNRFEITQGYAHDSDGGSELQWSTDGETALLCQKCVGGDEGGR